MITPCRTTRRMINVLQIFHPWLSTMAKWHEILALAFASPLLSAERSVYLNFPLPLTLTLPLCLLWFTVACKSPSLSESESESESETVLGTGATFSARSVRINIVMAVGLPPWFTPPAFLLFLIFFVLIFIYFFAGHSPLWPSRRWHGGDLKLGNGVHSRISGRQKNTSNKKRVKDAATATAMKAGRQQTTRKVKCRKLKTQAKQGKRKARKR